MNTDQWHLIEEAEKMALQVLKHNAKGPFDKLPRTAGWGYPEPYTRDLMIALPGFVLSGDPELMEQMRRVLTTLASNQSPHGQSPSLVHDPENRGSSDTTPLFLIGLAIFRIATGEEQFLEDAAQKALTWMSYQSPTDRNFIGQLPTTDWRDEQWVIGYGLFVNTLAYAYLQFFGLTEKAEALASSFSRFAITKDKKHNHVHNRLSQLSKPYYAFWIFKIYSSERFDLLGNSLAILTGMAPLKRSKEIISWINEECKAMIKQGDLAVDIAPNFFPYMNRDDPDWLDRYEEFNRPGEYHNGGIWPYISGFYISAIVAAEEYQLAEEKLLVLTEQVRKTTDKNLSFGFNEWIKAQDGTPRGQDWQTWSAAMYLYAARCVRERNTPYFDRIRSTSV
ncbi:glycoside hydrolase 100 family protein [Oceanispirochaeta sp.]|jgi:hypothetical protein|uniref:glycoside hydrolase 100 family protein n=1 Tax=Oceanispirochaeta sp. TaxID=2035350 RepID=UPI0026144197|nr:glycoside hydrolase 100 family protein [Oceanispirochaeta sp.]MDA3957222.1 hypothetical protein [Oceanispirochaeta sp.]